MTEPTRLTGLEGTNPLGFFAALGVQTLFAHAETGPRLWWTDTAVPHAVVDGEYDIEHITDQACREFPRWLESPALNPGFGTDPDDSKYLPDATAKFTPEHLRTYLENTLPSDIPGNRLASALVAEDSTDGGGRAKPTDLYFAAGPHKWLDNARALLAETTREDILRALTGPWDYSSKLSSLGWDIEDERVYALSAVKPSKAANKKLINPGAESLAVLGLSRHPVFKGQTGGRSRTLTAGCSGGWKQGGTYTWPLWTQPALFHTVRFLLSQTTGNSAVRRQRAEWYPGWGISRILESVIFRTSSGGYGSFRPPAVGWIRRPISDR